MSLKLGLKGHGRHWKAKHIINKVLRNVKLRKAI